MGLNLASISSFENIDIKLKFKLVLYIKNGRTYFHFQLLNEILAGQTTNEDAEEEDNPEEEVISCTKSITVSPHPLHIETVCLYPTYFLQGAQQGWACMILHEKHKLTLTCYKKFVHAFLNKGMINSNPTEKER